MGGRGASSTNISLGMGYTTTNQAVKLRTQVNKALGVGSDSASVKYSLRVDKASGKSNSQIIKEDKERLNKIKSRGKMSPQTKKFVNSYGEATNRRITTETYEKQQKKQAKQIMKYIGG